MAAHKIVSREEWLEARKEHLRKEKEFTRLRDELSRRRHELPWVKIDKPYLFHGPDGEQTLADLFAGRSQLIIYHFMFYEDWEQGCKSCSLLADSYAGAVAHLQARDVTMVTVSQAPLAKLDSFKRHMGWGFKWVSSGRSDFNFDFNVSFTDEEMERQSMNYNYRTGSFPLREGPGISAFYKDDDGAVYHTYSSYGRGLDLLITAYNLLDIVAKGRDEGDLPYTMQWVRHHDRYSDDPGNPGDDSFH